MVGYLDVLLKQILGNPKYHTHKEKTHMSVFTDWDIFPLKTQVGNLVANGKVTICGTVRVSFTLMNGSKGIFAGLPSKKSDKPGDDGKPIYYPDVKILDKATYDEFQEEAKAAYNTLLNSAPAPKGKSANVPF